MAPVSRLRLTTLWFSAFSLVALFYGPLFAWSPITPGFTRTTLGAVVYLHRTSRPLTLQHQRVPAEMAALERAVGLSFQGPVSVVLCDEPGDLTRFTPWLAAPPGLGARTLQFGTIVYVSPLVRDRGDAGAFIRHELVHVLLLRNTPLVSRAALLRHWWVFEGLSVHYGNPASYPLPPKSRLAAIRPELSSILDPDFTGPPSDVTVGERYALAGAFVGRLIERHKAAAWSGFVRASRRRSGTVASKLRASYGRVLRPCAGGTRDDAAPRQGRVGQWRYTPVAKLRLDPAGDGRTRVRLRFARGSHNTRGGDPGPRGRHLLWPSEKFASCCSTVVIEDGEAARLRPEGSDRRFAARCAMGRVIVIRARRRARATTHPAGAALTLQQPVERARRRS